MLNLLRRRKLPVHPADSAGREAAPACALSTCVAGTRATILTVGCGDVDACRLRALGLCEGTSVDIVRTRDHTLLEVRGTRIAVGSTIASNITVLPR